MSLSAYQSHQHLRYAAKAEVAGWLSTSSFLDVGVGEAGVGVVCAEVVHRVRGFYRRLGGGREREGRAGWGHDTVCARGGRDRKRWECTERGQARHRVLNGLVHLGGRVNRPTNHNHLTEAQ
jgi:hypothetical protein